MFRCTKCALELADGVDYTWCPKCAARVERIGVGVAPRSSVVPTPRRAGLWCLAVLVAVQAWFALADPYAFPYLQPLVVLALIATVPGAIAAIAFVPAVRGLLDERTRILHGLEHATLALLERRFGARGGGITLRGRFILEFFHDGRTSQLERAIRTATRDAIARVPRCRALAYSDRCSTSYVVGILVVSLAVASVIAYALMAGLAYGYAFAALVAAGALAKIAARPLGIAAQRALTVSTRFASARVGAIEREISADGERVFYVVDVTVEPMPSHIAEPV